MKACIRLLIAALLVTTLFGFVQPSPATANHNPNSNSDNLDITKCGYEFDFVDWLEETTASGFDYGQLDQFHSDLSDERGFVLIRSNCTSIGGNIDWFLMEEYGDKGSGVRFVMVDLSGIRNAIGHTITVDVSPTGIVSNEIISVPGDRDYTVPNGGTISIDKNEIARSFFTGQEESIETTNPGSYVDSTGGTSRNEEPEEEEEERETCEDAGFFSFSLCPLIYGADATLLFLNNKVVELLNQPDAYINNGSLEAVTNRVKNLAYTILIPIMLVMVISTALGFEFVSAYTLKKSLPRMFFAILFIAVSFQITSFMITATNEIGGGVLGFMTGVVSSDPITMASVFSSDAGDATGSLFAGFFAIAGIAAVGSIGIIASYAFITILSLATGLFLLALRQMILILLVILAPLAILSWIFPGNDKLWKIWWQSFSKLLLLFPLIMSLIAAGQIFAFLVNEAVPDPGLIEAGIKLLGFTAPYFFIPKMFQFAGGAFANLAGMANDREKGIFDRQKKYRGAKAAKNFSDFKKGDKSFRPQGFNNIGRRLGVGAKGHFGVGERGQQATALNAQANGDEALKNNPVLQKLAFNDDGNAVMALSGGSSAGALTAAKSLFHKEDTNGKVIKDSAGNAIYDKDRGDAAIAAAGAVGFNRSNARGAMTTLAQNKSRSVQPGQEGRDQMDAGIKRLADGNAQEVIDLRNNFAYHSSQSGRGDLGATLWEGGSQSLAGFERTGLYQAAGGDGKSVKAAGADAVALAAKGGPDGLRRAAQHRMELEAMLPNTSGPMRDDVIKSMEAIDGAGVRDWMKADAGNGLKIQYREDYNANEPLHNTWTTEDKARGWRGESRAQTNGETIKSRSYQRPDPNNEP
jgi:hypothetical protein